MKKIMFFISGLYLTFIAFSCINSGKTQEPNWQYLFTGNDLSGWVQKNGEAPFELVD